MGKFEERTPLGRPRRRWEDDINICIQVEKLRHGLDVSGLGQGQEVSDKHAACIFKVSLFKIDVQLTGRRNLSVV